MILGQNLKWQIIYPIIIPNLRKSNPYLFVILTSSIIPYFTGIPLLLCHLDLKFQFLTLINFTIFYASFWKPLSFPIVSQRYFWVCFCACGNFHGTLVDISYNKRHCSRQLDICKVCLRYVFAGDHCDFQWWWTKYRSGSICKVLFQYGPEHAPK